MCVFACVWAVVFFGMVPIVQKKTKCLNSQQRGGETDRRGEKQTKKQTKRARQRESDFCPGNLAVYRPRTVYRDDLNHVDCLLPVWCHLLTSAWIGWLRELPCVCLSTLAVQTFLSCTAGTDRQTDGSRPDQPHRTYSLTDSSHSQSQPVHPRLPAWWLLGWRWWWT